MADRAYIHGTGYWLPNTLVTNSAWPEGFGSKPPSVGKERTFNDIPPPSDVRASEIIARDLAKEAQDPFLGATYRYMADVDTTAHYAETKAAEMALSGSGIRGQDLDLIISYAVVPERVGLMTAGFIADAIGARRALGIGIEDACASSCVGLQMAQAYIESGLAQTVLLTQSHLMCRAFPMAHPASPGIGDAATAVVLSASPVGATYSVVSSFGQSHGEYAPAVTWVRDEGDAPWWKGGPDFRLGSLNPPLVKYLMQETVSFAGDTIRKACNIHGVVVEDLSALCSVQPRGFLPGAMAEYLGMDREKAITTYSEVAHIGACGPILNLHHYTENSNRTKRDEFVALYGQGAGFTRAAVVLEDRRAR